MAQISFLSLNFATKWQWENDIYGTLCKNCKSDKCAPVDMLDTS
nr:MAG TPA: hypothetical protein [Caudoviricetes sp.]